MDIVKVQYKSKDGEFSGREYSYYSDDALEVGDVIKIPVGDDNHEMFARVSSVKVPEAEIEAFKDKVKTIPAGSKVPGYPQFGKPAQETYEVESKIPSSGPIELSKLLNHAITIPGLTVYPDCPHDDCESNIDGKCHAERICDWHPDYAAGNELTAVVNVSPEQDEKFKWFLNEIAIVKDKANILVVDSQETEKAATDDLALMSGLKKQIDEKRKEYVGPLNDFVNAINKSFKTITEPLEEVDKLVRGKVRQYKLDVEAKRKQAEETNRMAEEVAKRQAEQNHGEFTVDTTPVPVPAPAKFTRANVGTSGLADNWVYEVVDISLVPREFMIIDDAMMKSIAKAHHDKKPVPGIKFKNEPILKINKR